LRKRSQHLWDRRRLVDLRTGLDAADERNLALLGSAARRFTD
jgi:hypothetical protein